MDEIIEERLERQSEANNDEGTTLLRTCYNGTNVLSGVGILSIPYAVSQGGWLSLIFLFLIASICWYTGILLRRCMDSNPQVKTYPDIAKLAFGYKAKVIVSILLYLELYLLAVEFLILEGDNLQKLFPKMGIKIGGLKIGAKKTFILLASLLVLPTTWVKSLGILAYISVVGVLAPLVLIICVLWVGVGNGVGFHEGEKGMLLNWRGLPRAISLFTFCYCGHAVFPTLCNSMKDRRKFSKVLLVCFITSTITYASMAVLGYLMYGEHLDAQVTLNLPIKKTATKVAIYTTLISPLTKYAVILTPIANAIEETTHFKNNKSLSFSIRTVLVVSTTVVALTLPFFGDIMSFIGAFLGVIMSLLLPCLCYLKINKSARKFGFELILIIGIMISGSFVGIVGTYLSLKQIIKHI